MAVSRTQTTEVSLPLDEAFEKCLKADQALRRAKLADFQEDSGTIRLNVGMSLKSFGERVTLQLREADGSATSIEVTSRASWPLTLADYGKNADNVQKLVDWLAKLSSSGETAHP
jgi:hypothetical protein